METNHQKLIPINDRVIVEPVSGPEKVGGIFIPDMAREKGTQGRVVAVGQGRWSDHGYLIPMTVKVGDFVIFNEYTASKIKVDGVELSMLHEHEINCILKK